MRPASPASLRTDVLVVGAGPAGATAARTLASAGVSVRLVERAVFPRHKPCGGALSARVVHRFPYLEPALARIPTRWISRLELAGPSGVAVQLQSAAPAALMIRRVDFDALLAALATEAGADLATGGDVVGAAEDEWGVSVATRDGRRFSARFLIACDGVHSPTARRLGMVGAWPRSALAIDMMEETPNADLRPRDPGLLWVQYGCAAPGANGSSRLWEGYGYVFPKKDHVNVGIGYLLAPYRNAGAGSAYPSHRRFVERLTREGVLAGRSRRDCFTPFLLPIQGPRPVLSGGRTLLAGDAAGFVHGLTAEGIYYAMVSGDLAAKAAIRALRSDGCGAPALSAYERSWRSEIGTELRDAVLLQRYLFGSPGRVEAVVAGARDRKTSRAVIAYLSGDMTYAAVRSQLLSRGPRVVISAATEAVGRLWRCLRA